MGIILSFIVLFVIIAVRFKWYITSIKVSLFCVWSYQNSAALRTLPVLSIANCVVSNYTFTVKLYITDIKVSLILLYLIISERSNGTLPY
jgi:hypothetical protein